MVQATRNWTSPDQRVPPGETTSTLKNGPQLAGQPLGLGFRLFQVSDHVEGLFGEVVNFAFDDPVEVGHFFGEVNPGARDPGELLGHEERLREETLDAAGA